MWEYLNDEQHREAPQSPPHKLCAVGRSRNVTPAECSRTVITDC